MSYDIPGYDGWKLATPWDDEIATTVSFECNHCDEYNDDVDVVIGRKDDEVYVDCYNCNAENTVSLGE
jgi:hypothetical protein